jgi:hypothetical protein
MEKEKIDLTGFIKESLDALREEEGVENIVDGIELEPVTVIEHRCSKCNKWYEEGTKFCNDDGAQVVTKEIQVKHEAYGDFVYDMLLGLTEDGGCPETFGYEYVDSIEKRGDGSGYYMNYIFKRKSDGKYFYYTSYDGRVEENTLDETKQEVKVTWDFERYFS